MDKIDALISNFETMVSLDARCNVWVAPGKLDTARAALRAEYERMENDNARMKTALEKIRDWSGTYPSDTFSMSRAIDSIFRIAREGLEK
jgi:hypothetical protein